MKRLGHLDDFICNYNYSTGHDISKYWGYCCREDTAWHQGTAIRLYSKDKTILKIDKFYSNYLAPVIS
ncbi:hypothetical protein [Dapis sp. BLCC M229]|uniref:hypothetical protein n=1 Tax=Dapis sp. BLCC M229 TaxID=3400188 RepID=UPI003CF04C60